MFRKIDFTFSEQFVRARSNHGGWGTGVAESLAMATCVGSAFF